MSVRFWVEQAPAHLCRKKTRDSAGSFKINGIL